MSQIYDRVALIGLGLIASSIFWASKRNNVSGCITGFARSKKTRDTAKKIGLCDEIFDTAEEAVQDADLVKCPSCSTEACLAVWYDIFKVYSS